MFASAPLSYIQSGVSQINHHFLIVKHDNDDDDDDDDDNDTYKKCINFCKL